MWGFRAFLRNPLTGEHLVVLKDWTRQPASEATVIQLLKLKEEPRCN